MGDIVIVTFWNSFDQHEASHADKLFKQHFSKLEEFCDGTFEVGYEMLWSKNQLFRHWGRSNLVL